MKSSSTLIFAARSAAYDPVQRRSAVVAMNDELERLAESCPDLTNKVADLQSQLDQWSRQSSDDDVPFGIEAMRGRVPRMIPLGCRLQTDETSLIREFRQLVERQNHGRQ